MEEWGEEDNCRKRGLISTSLSPVCPLISDQGERQRVRETERERGRIHLHGTEMLHGN